MADPIVTPALISGGASALSNIAQSIFNSKDDKRIKRFLDFLQNQIGTDVISDERQESLFRNVDASLAPGRNRLAQSIQNRVGLDSGVGLQDLFTGTQSERSRQRFNIGLENERLRASRDRNFASTITSGELGLI